MEQFSDSSVHYKDVGKIVLDDVNKFGLSEKEFYILQNSRDDLESIMDNKEQKEILVNLLLKIGKSPSSNSKVLLYVFARISNILDVYNNSSDASNKENNSLILFPHGIIDNELFLNGLNNVDITLQKISALCYAYCLTKCSNGDFSNIIAWSINNFSYTSNIGFEDVIPVLVTLFKSEQARDVFLQNGGLVLIINLIKKIGANGNAQQLYELTFLVWTLALVSDNYVNIFLSSGTIPYLVDILSAAPSRKVVRMALATLRHLSNSENGVILNEMLTAQLDKILTAMISSNAHKQSGDLEVESDCKALSEILTKNYRELSTFDRWASEVQSGALRWGIVHTEKFWRENNKFVEANDFQLLKKLIVLLSSEDSTICSIALYDLGEFTRFYPSGRVVTSHLGGKEIALQLLVHPDERVQNHALQCISKIMITNWEFMR